MHALGLEVVEDAIGGQTHLASRQETTDELTGGIEISEVNPEYMRASRLVAKELGVLPGQQAVLANGRVSNS
jgi:hypothetical protein